MGVEPIEINMKGKPVSVPSIIFENRTILVQGKWIRIAAVHDEDWVEGEIIKDPESVVARLKRDKLEADLFTFAQKIPL